MAGTAIQDRMEILPALDGPDQETFVRAVESTVRPAAIEAEIAARDNREINTRMFIGYGSALREVEAWFAARSRHPGAAPGNDAMPHAEIMYLLRLMETESGLQTEALTDGLARLKDLDEVVRWLVAQVDRSVADHEPVIVPTAASNDANG